VFEAKNLRLGCDSPDAVRQFIGCFLFALLVLYVNKLVDGGVVESNSESALPQHRKFVKVRNF
jgi:hypothetical protein